MAVRVLAGPVVFNRDESRTDRVAGIAPGRIATQYAGRDFRFTDVKGSVVTDIFA